MRLLARMLGRNARKDTVTEPSQDDYVTGRRSRMVSALREAYVRGYMKATEDLQALMLHQKKSRISALLRATDFALILAEWSKEENPMPTPPPKMGA